jgi:hypothetical protein
MGTYTSTSSHRGADILSLSDRQIKQIQNETRLLVIQDLFSGMAEGELKMLIKVDGNVVMKDMSGGGAVTSGKIVATKEQLTGISQELENRLVLDGNKLRVAEPDITIGWYQDAKGDLYQYLGEREWNLPNTKITREEATKMALNKELEFLN